MCEVLRKITQPLWQISKKVWASCHVELCRGCSDVSACCHQHHSQIEKLNLLEMCFNAHSKVEDIGLGPRSGQARPAGDLSGRGLARSRLSTRSLTSPKLEINNSTQIHLQSLLSICIFGECRQLLETGTESGSRIIHSNSSNHETADEASTLCVDTAATAALRCAALCSYFLDIVAGWLLYCCAPLRLNPILQMLIFGRVWSYFYRVWLR